MNQPIVGAAIRGTGLAVPKRVLTNHDLEKIVDTSDEWIVKRTGINTRHRCESPGELTRLAADATQQAMTAAGLASGELDLLICATMTPEMSCPAMGAQIVAELGAAPCGAMDVNLACSGFVLSMNIAANFIATGAAKNVAVVGAERLSRIVNWEDRSTCILFGDGAGAAILSASDEPGRGCYYQSLHTDGNRWADLYVPRNQGDLPEKEGFNGQFETLQMNGREVFRFAVNTLQNSIKDAMTACSLTADDIKMIVPHQSNTRILGSARQKLGIPEEKLYINLDRYGNTSAASVGICLHELMDSGRIEAGDTVLFVALGGGLSWATSVWRI
jgi:3-oxoacyl-[acyl-carrier-protein] synthase-3